MLQVWGIGPRNSQKYGSGLLEVLWDEENAKGLREGKRPVLDDEDEEEEKKGEGEEEEEEEEEKKGEGEEKEGNGGGE